MGYELSSRAEEAHGRFQMWTSLPVRETSFEAAYREAYDESADLAQQAAVRKMIMGLRKPE